MSGWILLGIAVGLAMDASAVALAASIKLCRATWPQTLRLAAAFGLFQGLMPILGWMAGRSVARYIEAWDHWVAFALLALVGGHMFWESFQNEDNAPRAADPTRGWTLWGLAVATSIDALAVGLSFSLLDSSIWIASLVIGLVTALLTALSARLGCRLGLAFGRRMDAFGGLVLVAIGVKILLEHF